MEDLWPSDIATTEKVSPVTIMREQARMLGEKTGNRVIGEVKPLADLDPYGKEDDVVHYFYLSAPALGHYRYKLFMIRNAFPLYPVKIEADSDVMAEIASEFEEALEAKSENEFVDILKRIFRARKTREVVESLIAQVGGAGVNASPQ